MARAKEVELLIKDNLLNHPTKISLVIDLWLSFNRQNYMAINKYYIDTEKYHETLLIFEYIPEQHTGLNLAQMLDYVLIKYEI